MPNTDSGASADPPLSQPEPAAACADPRTALHSRSRQTNKVAADVCLRADSDVPHRQTVQRLASSMAMGAVTIPLLLTLQSPCWPVPPDQQLFFSLVIRQTVKQARHRKILLCDARSTTPDLFCIKHAVPLVL